MVSKSHINEAEHGKADNEFRAQKWSYLDLQWLAVIHPDPWYFCDKKQYMENEKEYDTINNW